MCKFLNNLFFHKNLADNIYVNEYKKRVKYSQQRNDDFQKPINKTKKGKINYEPMLGER
jgi:hypothetical protein